MDRYTDMLLHWENLRRRGENVGAEALCPHDEPLRQKLAETIELVEAYESLMSVGGDTAGPENHPVPERIGKYEVRRILGVGGMGFVYEGWDPILARTVAIKVIKPRHDPVGAKRAVTLFLREGQLLAKFARKSVVAALEAGEHDSRPYLVMDYFPGGNLTQHRERLTAAGPRAIVPLMEKVARAVQDAHDEGILHRDLKPGNVLLDAKGNPFVADFGLAAILAGDEVEAGHTTGEADPRAVTLTCAGGTPGYMSPEQYGLGSQPAGKPADVWALGVILYELLMGRKPFVESDRAMLYEQVTQSPTPALAGISKPLAAIVYRCLEKDPSRRYQSAGELADELHRLHQPARRRAIRAGLAAVFLVALLGLGWWALRSPAAKPDPDLEAYTDPSAIQNALARLERGETVALVEPGNLPSHRFVLGEGLSNGQVRLDGGQVRIHARGELFVEFLPRLPAGDWAIQTRIRHNRAITTASVIGLFAARSQRRAEGTAKNLLAAVHYGDEVDAATLIDPNRVAQAAIWYIASSRTELELYPQVLLKSYQFPERGPALRELRLVVRDARVIAFCDNKPLDEIGEAVVDRFRPKSTGNGDPTMECPFNPRGGLGLLLRDGELWVESLTVSPL